MKIVVMYSSPTERKASEMQNNILENVRKELNITKEQFDNECKFVEKNIGTDTQIKKILAISLGTLLFVNEQAQRVYAGGLGSLETGGNKILAVIYSVGKWLLIANCIAGILRWSLQQDLKGKRQALGSVAAYAGIYAVPKIFDFIAELFQ